MRRRPKQKTGTDQILASLVRLALPATPRSIDARAPIEQRLLSEVFKSQGRRVKRKDGATSQLIASLFGPSPPAKVFRWEQLAGRGSKLKMSKWVLAATIAGEVFQLTPRDRALVRKMARDLERGLK